MISFSESDLYLVTGASSGIGEAVALLINKLGGRVIGIGRDESRLKNLKSSCDDPERIYIEKKDLAEDVEGLTSYVTELRKKYGKLKGFVSCAGIFAPSGCRFLDFKQLNNVFTVNYFAPIMLAKGFIDRRNNVGKGSAAVFVASVAAEWALKGSVAYCGSKAALISSAKSIAREVVSNGIRINCVSPAAIKSPMLINSQQGNLNKNLESESMFKSEYPLGFGKPEDAANVIAFLLSDKASWLTGVNYEINCLGRMADNSLF